MVVRQLEEGLRTESVKGNKTNICNGCKNEIPTCKPEFLIFGDGVGNDNVVGCDIFEAIKKKQKFIFFAEKGATAYELQIGNTVFRFVHLMGGKWKWWNFWNRISVKKYPPEGQ